MNKKCLGCGIPLQDKDINLDGYISNIDKNICTRCFKIKNYGVYNKANMSNKDYMKIIDSITNNDLVIYVSSLLNLNIDYINKFKDVILVLTKRDILPKSVKDNKIIDYIKKRYNNIKDIMTGYRAFSYEFVKGFPVLSKGFEIETEMTIHAVDKNFKLVEVPVNYRDRPEGSISKLNTYRDGFRVLKTIFTLFKEYKPTFFFNTLTLIFLALALILGIPVVGEYIKTGLVPRFPSLIVASIFTVISLLLWITGIILQVIVKKHKQLYELMLTQIVRNKKEEIKL